MPIAGSDMTVSMPDRGSCTPSTWHFSVSSLSVGKVKNDDSEGVSGSDFHWAEITAPIRDRAASATSLMATVSAALTT